MLDKVSVIIVNWNCEQFLGRCLPSLMSQVVKPFEIILVDNASSDGSIEIVRRFPSVRLVALDQNIGFARGNNLAVEMASTEAEWIALINPDAFAEANWLEELLAAAQRNPEFDVFGSKLLNAGDPSVLDGTGDVYHVSGLVWRRGYGTGVPLIEMKTESETFSACAAAVLYRRSVFLEVNGFDEDFFCYVEDIDLGFRLRLAGYRCFYVPLSVVHHIGSGTTGGGHSDFTVYHGHRNLVWAYVKNMPGILFWMLLPLHLFMNISAMVLFVMRGQGNIIFKAKWDALKGLPQAWRKRREIQAKRVATIGEIWRVLDKRLFLFFIKPKSGIDRRK